MKRYIRFAKDNSDKHIFEWSMEMAWDDDGKVIIPKSDYDVKPSDKDAKVYMRSINNAFKANKIPEKVVSVDTLCSYGGGWPSVRVRTTEPMTLKQFYDYFTENVEDDGTPFEEFEDLMGIFEIKIAD